MSAAFWSDGSTYVQQIQLRHAAVTISALASTLGASEPYAAHSRASSLVPTASLRYLQRGHRCRVPRGDGYFHVPATCATTPPGHLCCDHDFCCPLTYALSQFDVVQFDLGDIDTKTVIVKQIGNTWWAVFKTRNFSKSVQYKHPKDPSLDYDAENGGFSLDEDQTANSFAKALTRAAELCGSSPSSF